MPGLFIFSQKPTKGISILKAILLFFHYLIDTFIIGGKIRHRLCHIDYFQLYVYRFPFLTPFVISSYFLHEFSGLIHNPIIGRISFGFEGTHLMADDQLDLLPTKVSWQG